MRLARANNKLLFSGAYHAFNPAFVTWHTSAYRYPDRLVCTLKSVCNLIAGMAIKNGPFLRWAMFFYSGVMQYSAISAAGI